MYHSTTCDRSREWAAFALDGELSLLEERLLDAHLARCAECERFARDIGSVTEALRAEPLEYPASAIALPTGARGRRISSWRLATAGKAAAVAAVAVGAFSVGTHSSSDVREVTPPRPVIVDGATATSAQDEPEELRAYRYIALLEEKNGPGVPAPERTGPQPG
jgi:anti-sigma factor RsiW